MSQADANNCDQIFEQEVSQFFEWPASLRTSTPEKYKSDLEKTTTTANMLFSPLDYQQPMDEYPNGDWRPYSLFPVYTDHQKHSLFMFTEESTKRYPNDDEYDKEFILSHAATEQYYGRSASKGILNTTPLKHKSEEDGIQVLENPSTYQHLTEMVLRLSLSTIAFGLMQQSNNPARPAAPWSPNPSYSATSWSPNPSYSATSWLPKPSFSATSSSPNLSSSATSWSSKSSSSAKSWSPNPYAKPWSPNPNSSAKSWPPNPSSSTTPLLPNSSSSAESWSPKSSSSATSWSSKSSSSAKSWSPNPHAKPWSANPNSSARSWSPNLSSSTTPLLPNSSSSAESWSTNPSSSASSDDLQYFLINPELDDMQALSFVVSDPQQTSF